MSVDVAGIRVVWETASLGRGTRSAQWDQVLEVVAFKCDLLAVDLICLEFGVTNSPPLVVTEEMEGWEELTRALAEYLPGVQPFEEWYAAVVKPPFERCETKIWSRLGATV